LKQPDRPDAVVVLDDFMALGVSIAARELGLSIPNDLGVASFNDTSLCEAVGGGLTSVNLNIPALVKQTVERLIRIIDEEDIPVNRRLIIPAKLSIRHSTLREGAKR
jgi:DNA-binding LacI/PurR family transcriptional regulator